MRHCCPWPCDIAVLDPAPSCCAQWPGLPIYCQALIPFAIEELCEASEALIAPVRMGVTLPSTTFSMLSTNQDIVTRTSSTFAKLPFPPRFARFAAKVQELKVQEQKRNSSVCWQCRSVRSRAFEWCPAAFRCFFSLIILLRSDVSDDDESKSDGGNRQVRPVVCEVWEGSQNGSPWEKSGLPDIENELQQLSAKNRPYNQYFFHTLGSRGVRQTQIWIALKKLHEPLG